MQQLGHRPLVRRDPLVQPPLLTPLQMITHHQHSVVHAPLARLHPPKPRRLVVEELVQQPFLQQPLAEFEHELVLLLGEFHLRLPFLHELRREAQLAE